MTQPPTAPRQHRYRDPAGAWTAWSECNGIHFDSGKYEHRDMTDQPAARPVAAERDWPTCDECRKPARFLHIASGINKCHAHVSGGPNSKEWPGWVDRLVHFSAAPPGRVQVIGDVDDPTKCSCGTPWPCPVHRAAPPASEITDWSYPGIGRKPASEFWKYVEETAERVKADPMWQRPVPRRYCHAGSRVHVCACVDPPHICGKDEKCINRAATPASDQPPTAPRDGEECLCDGKRVCAHHVLHPPTEPRRMSQWECPSCGDVLSQGSGCAHGGHVEVWYVERSAYDALAASYAILDEKWHALRADFDALAAKLEQAERERDELIELRQSELADDAKTIARLTRELTVMSDLRLIDINTMKSLNTENARLTRELEHANGRENELRSISIDNSRLYFEERQKNAALREVAEAAKALIARLSPIPKELWPFSEAYGKALAALAAKEGK